MIDTDNIRYNLKLNRKSTGIPIESLQIITPISYSNNENTEAKIFVVKDQNQNISFEVNSCRKFKLSGESIPSIQCKTGSFKTIRDASKFITKEAKSNNPKRKIYVKDIYDKIMNDKKNAKNMINQTIQGHDFTYPINFDLELDIDNITFY